MKRERRQQQHGIESKSFRIIQPASKCNAKPTAKVLPPPPTATATAAAADAAKTLLPSELSKRPKSAAKIGARARCDAGPVSKSRDKVKGAHKLKSCDVLLNHRLLGWQVAGGRSFPHYGELSASGILDHLYANSGQEEEEECEDYNGGNGEQESSLGAECGAAKADDDDEEGGMDSAEVVGESRELSDGEEDWFMVERPCEA